jgi:hypothetical protein
VSVSQFTQYPKYFVEIKLVSGEDSQGSIGFWITNKGKPFANGDPYPGYSDNNGPGFLPSGDVIAWSLDSLSGLTSSLLASIKSWAEAFDWDTAFGWSGVTVSSVKVTKYTEALSDVSPS